MGFEAILTGFTDVTLYISLLSFWLCGFVFKGAILGKVEQTKTYQSSIIIIGGGGGGYPVAYGKQEDHSEASRPEKIDGWEEVARS
jgi:hypothetical protein